MRTFSVCLVVAMTWLPLGVDSQAADEPVVSPNRQVPHLGLHGSFTIDPSEISAKDPRNPTRVVFREMEIFSFYDDQEGNMPLAQGCRSAYEGAAGDPFYYPEKSKASIWELFELTVGDSACERFMDLIVRAPHGNPVHLHMRDGGPASGFERLLSMSQEGPEDKTKVNPWWSVYCAEGKSECDK